MPFLQFVIEFFRGERSDEGATAVEYALLIGVITIALAAAAVPLATKIGTVFTAVTTAV